MKRDAADFGFKSVTHTPGVGGRQRLILIAQYKTRAVGHPAALVAGQFPINLTHQGRYARVRVESQRALQGRARTGKIVSKVQRQTGKGQYVRMVRVGPQRGLDDTVRPVDAGQPEQGLGAIDRNRGVSRIRPQRGEQSFGFVELLPLKQLPCLTQGVRDVGGGGGKARYADHFRGREARNLQFPAHRFLDGHRAGTRQIGGGLPPRAFKRLHPVDPLTRNEPFEAPAVHVGGHGIAWTGGSGKDKAKTHLLTRRQSRDRLAGFVTCGA